jgi:hypothetical protein
MHPPGFTSPLGDVLRSVSIFSIANLRNISFMSVLNSQVATREVYVDGLYAVRHERFRFLNVIIGPGGGIEAFLKQSIGQY